MDKEAFRRFLSDYQPRTAQPLFHPTDEAITDSFEFHHELVVRGYRFRPLDPTFNGEWIVNGAAQAAQVPFLLNRKMRVPLSSADLHFVILLNFISRR